MFQKPKWGGFTLPSVESNHILRDPPKSIHTRKKERISAADVNYMIRENTDRTNDGIQKFARGVNPMVGVNYVNSGGGSKLATKGKGLTQAHNTYKVAKDGAFRPPIFRQEDLLPLSRLKRKNTSVDGVPGSNLSYVRTVDQSGIDKGQINSIIKPSFLYSADTNLSAKMYERPAPDLHIIEKGILIKPNIEVSTGKCLSLDVTNMDRGTVTREIKEEPLRSYLGPTYKVALYHPQTEQLTELVLPDNIKEQITASTNIGASINLPVTQGQGSQQIKLKDYTWAIHQTPKSNVLVIQPRGPEVCLTRKNPIISAFGLAGAPKIADNFNRVAYLAPKVCANDARNGGIDNMGVQTDVYMTNVVPSANYFNECSRKKDCLRESMKDYVPTNFSRDN